MPSRAEDELPIRTIAALTGVNPITLRAWERRYGLVRPTRSAGGQRLYTQRHVEQIRRALALVERGVPISRVRERLEVEPVQRAPRSAPSVWAGPLESMLSATARFDEPELDRIYDEALSVHPVERVTRQLLLPLLARLGERWKDVPGAIAEEHFFASYLRSKLGARLQRRMRYASGPLVLAACAAGEHHEIGLLLFALEAHEAGLRTVVLGADVPLGELPSARRRSGARAVVISSSIDPAPHLWARALPALVAKAGVPVFVGGPSALRHKAAIEAAGAIAVGTDLEHGVRLVGATLRRAEAAR